MNAGKKAYQRNQQQDSMQQRKEKQDTNTAIGTTMTLSYMQELGSMPSNQRSIKAEVTKTTIQHANYVEKKRKT